MAHGTSIGSKATPSAIGKAARTALRGSVSLPSHEPRPQTLVSQPRPTHPGSRAGLKDAKSVHLNMNNVGYLNPANQTARLKDRTKQVDVTIPNRTVISRNNYKNFDSRLTGSKSSSISLINKRSR